MEKIKQMIKHIRWKVLFYINPGGENMQPLYVFKTLKCHPKIKEMVSFDRDLWHLVAKTKFQKFSSNFQKQLKEGIKTTKKSERLFDFPKLFFSGTS